MKRKLKFIIPCFITLLILLIIFYFNDLYPFSNNSIVQVDADYQFIPVLYRIYDFLHGNGNIIYDDIGFGNNIYISMIIQGSIFSPLSLLLYFTSRSNIVNFYNIIVMIKICLVSLTTYIYINKTFKIKEYYKIVFSVLYAFSGWILLNYFNIMWLDSVILFPLIIMFLNELFNNDKYIGYVITLSLSLIISYYMSYFILLFILFYSFIYIFLKVDKDKVKRLIFKLGISTVIAILISSFSLLPALYQTFISSRFDNSGGNVIFYNFINKSIYLMFSSIFLVFFTLLVFKYKKDKKNIYCYIVLFILFVIGLFVEPINLALHMGSYWSFPYRYSFITLFILMNGSLYYLERYEYKGLNKYQVIRFVVFLLLGGSLLYLNNLYYKDIVDSQIVLDFDDIEVYKNIILIFVVLVVMIFVSITFKNKIFRYISFSIVCLLQIFIYSSWTMYYSSGYYLSKNANMLNDNLDIVKDDLDRYKMGYTNYTPDYGFIYGVNTLDNWLHILPKDEIDIYKRLGYRNTDTCIRSYGGTIFSDWLFNVGYLIGVDEYDNGMYNLIDYYDRYYLYEYNYNNGFGLVYDRVNNTDYDIMYGFELHNSIYRDLFNKDSDIIKIDEYFYTDVDDMVSVKYDVQEKGFLYINLYNEIDYIKVNGEFIDSDGYDYIIDLGIYEDDVIIDIVMKYDSYVNFSLGFISYDDIMNLSNNVDDVMKVYNGYNVNVENDMDNGYLFLPINNISGLKVYVNDRDVEVNSYMGNFVSVKLDKGYNEIEIRYEMPLFKLGIILSIFGVICLLLFNRIFYNNIILNCSYYIYILVCLLLYLYIYGLSFFKYYNY